MSARSWAWIRLIVAVWCTVSQGALALATGAGFWNAALLWASGILIGWSVDEMIDARKVRKIQKSLEGRR